MGEATRNRAHAGRPLPDGTVREVAKLGGWISHQFTVLQDGFGDWWMVGQLPMLSSRVVAYPLSSPTGRVTGEPVEVARLPDPGPDRIAYSVLVHPELDGLLTWAVNGTGPGTPYGLQRRDRFWPESLVEAQLAASVPADGSALAATVAAVVSSLTRDTRVVAG